MNFNTVANNSSIGPSKPCLRLCPFTSVVPVSTFSSTFLSQSLCLRLCLYFLFLRLYFVAKSLSLSLSLRFSLCFYVPGLRLCIYISLYLPLCVRLSPRLCLYISLYVPVSTYLRPRQSFYVSVFTPLFLSLCVYSFFSTSLSLPIFLYPSVSLIMSVRLCLYFLSLLFVCLYVFPSPLSLFFSLNVSVCPNESLRLSFYVCLLGSDIVGGEKWNYAVEHSTVYLYIEKMAGGRPDFNQE